MLDTLVRASIDGAIFAALVWILSRTVSCLPAAAKAFLWWCVAAKFVVALVWTTPVFVPLLPAPGPASPTTAPIVHSSSSGVEPAVEAGGGRCAHDPVVDGGSDRVGSRLWHRGLSRVRSLAKRAVSSSAGLEGSRTPAVDDRRSGGSDWPPTSARRAHF